MPDGLSSRPSRSVSHVNRSMTSKVLEAAGDTGVAAQRAPPLVARLWRGRDVLIAALALTGILIHLTIRYGIGASAVAELPLLMALGVGGALLVPELVWQAAHGKFRSDHSQYVDRHLGASRRVLAGAIVVLMLSGGETLQRFAIGRATSALRALARRVPTMRTAIGEIPSTISRSMTSGSATSCRSSRTNSVR